MVKQTDASVSVGYIVDFFMVVFISAGSDKSARVTIWLNLFISSSEFMPLRRRETFHNQNKVIPEVDYRASFLLSKTSKFRIKVKKFQIKVKTFEVKKFQIKVKKFKSKSKSYK